MACQADGPEVSHSLFEVFSWIGTTTALYHCRGTYPVNNVANLMMWHRLTTSFESAFISPAEAQPGPEVLPHFSDSTDSLVSDLSGGGGVILSVIRNHLRMLGSVTTCGFKCFSRQSLESYDVFSNLRLFIFKLPATNAICGL